jgi:hypothetical protein
MRPGTRDGPGRGAGAVEVAGRHNRELPRQDTPSGAASEPTLDDYAAGVAARDEGTRQALDAADTRGRLAGAAAIRRRARTRELWSTDHLHDDVGDPLACRPAVMGALILAALRRGEIVRVGDVHSRRPEARGRRIGLYRGTL